MEYVYLWEIDGRVCLGVSSDPSAKLRALESDLGVRAVKVFSTPMTNGIQSMIQQLLGAKLRHTYAYISLTFSQAKDKIITSL